MTLHRQWFEPADGAVDGTVPLVLLHEGLGSVSAWGPFPQDLADTTGRRLLAYDRAGYGRSRPNPGPWPADFMHAEASALADLLADEGVDRSILVGHSDGASIALLYPSQTPPEAAAVVGIVSMSAHVVVEPISVSSIAEVRSTYADGLDRALARHHDDADAVFEAWSEVWVSDRFRSWAIDAELAAVACPVLAVQGDGDRYGTEHQLERLVAGVRGEVELCLIPDIDHWPHREATTTVLDLISGFCRRADAQRT